MISSAVDLYVGGGSARRRFIVVYTSLRCIVFFATVVLFAVRSCRVVLPCRRYHRLHHSSALPMTADLQLQMHELRMCIHSTRPPASDPNLRVHFGRGYPSISGGANQYDIRLLAVPVISLGHTDGGPVDAKHTIKKLLQTPSNYAPNVSPMACGSNGKTTQQAGASHTPMQKIRKMMR